MARYKRPCFDSSTFIGGINDEIVNGIKRGVVFRYLWERAKAGDFKVFISALTLAEVYKTKRHPTPGEPVLDEFLEKIEESFVEVIEIDREIGLEAHALCRKFAAQKLYPGDAFHLACAARAGCDVLLAWDGPFAAIGQYRSVSIEAPRILEPNLFTESEQATEDEIRAYDLRTGRLVKAPATIGKDQGGKQKGQQPKVN